MAFFQNNGLKSMYDGASLEVKITYQLFTAFTVPGLIYSLFTYTYFSKLLTLKTFRFTENRTSSKVNYRLLANKPVPHLLFPLGRWGGGRTPPRTCVGEAYTCHPGGSLISYLWTGSKCGVSEYHNKENSLPPSLQRLPRKAAPGSSSPRVALEGTADPREKTRDPRGRGVGPRNSERGPSPTRGDPPASGREAEPAARASGADRAAASPLPDRRRAGPPPSPRSAPGRPGDPR